MILDRAGRAGLALVVVTLATASLWFAPQASGATASGRCSGTDGVSVVVDFGPLAGGTQVVCTGAGGDAKAVTERGGFPVDYLTNGQPFVCRISGQPDQSRESCGRTPPEDAYWAMFWSDGSSGWKYSSRGAASTTPRNGWSIGWRFQNGGAQDLPSAAPRRNAASPTPRPTSSPEPAPGPKPTRTPKPAATPRPAEGASSPAASTAAAAPRTPGTPRKKGTPGADGTARPSAAKSATLDPTDDPTDAPSDAPSEDPTEAESAVAEGSFATVDDAAPSGGDGTGIAAVAGLGGLSLLAGSAAVVTWRRRT